MKGPKRFISLVLAEDQINFMEFTAKRGKLDVLSFGGHFCKFNNYDELEKIIKTISNSVGKTKYTYITLLTSDFLKHIYYIKGGSAEPKNVILQEFKNIYDIKLNEYYIDYSYEEIDNGLLTFCCGIRKEIIEPVLEILTKYNFKLLSLVPGIVAITNGIIHAFKNMDCVYLNIFNNKLIISLISEGNLFTFREINFGIEDVADNLSREGGINLDEAVRLIYSQGLLNDESDEFKTNVYNNIAESFDKISMEIQKTLDYYFITFRRKKIENFILSFGFKDIPGVEDYFKKLFGINVHRINLQEFIRFSGVKDELFELKYLDICISMALR